MFEPQATSPVPVTFPAEGIFVLESRHRSGFAMSDTKHDYLKVLCAFRGSGSLVTPSQRHPLRSGDIALVPPGCVHRLEDSGDPLWLYGVCVRPAVLESVPEARSRLNQLRVYAYPPWSGEVSTCLRALLIEQSRALPAQGAFITGLAWQLLGLIWRAAESRPAKSFSEPEDSLSQARVAAYWRDLPQRFHQETSLNEAAASLGLSRRTFSSLFRAVAGTSWLQAVRRLRIEHAKRLLRETRRSATSVAFESGFSDLSHFYRVFRAETGGISPSAWRRSRATKRPPRTSK